MRMIMNLRNIENKNKKEKELTFNLHLLTKDFNITTDLPTTVQF